MSSLFDKDVYDDYFYELVESDDKERFVKLLLALGPDSVCMYAVNRCAQFHARKCLLALIEGEGCEPANKLYARIAATPNHSDYELFNPTPLASVAYYYHVAYDIIDLLLQRGGVEHVNIKSSVNFFDSDSRLPLDHLLVCLSYATHLHPWAPGDSLHKLIILLCQWKTRPSLKSARLLASHTDGINDIAWTYVRDGRLASLAALLLVAQEKVLVPFDSGMSIQQRITDMVHTLSSGGDLSLEGAKYQSMLLDAFKVLDIFKRAGAALSLYCSSMHEYIPPDKVLIDVASLLKEAGCTVHPLDLDLRDCYRGYPELCNASLFKLSSPPRSSINHILPSSLTQAQYFGTKCYSYSHVQDCQLLRKLKLGPMNLVPTSMPRQFTTAAVPVDRQKQFASLVFRLKRRIKF